MGAATSATAAPQIPITPTWAHDSGTEGWIPGTVSIGARGTQVLTQFGPFNDFTRLFAAGTSAAATPVWQHTDSTVTRNHHVSSADTANVHVSLHDYVLNAQLGTRALLLRCYSSNASTPQWEVVLPTTTNGHANLGVRVSRDGQRIVTVVYNIYTGKHDFSTFSPSSPIPLLTASFSLSGAVDGLDLSADGSRLAVTTPQRIAVWNTTTGVLDFSYTPFQPLYRTVALSGDGTLLAYGTDTQCRVFQRSGSTYQLRFSHVIPGTNHCGAVDFSDDGTTLVAGFNHITNNTFRTVQIDALDVTASLASGQPVVLASNVVTSTATLDNLVTKVAISDHGEVWVAGLWGDELGPVPEILAFRRGVSGIWKSDNLEGSVQDLELSADGRHVVVASKAHHNNLFSGGGRVALYDLTAGDVQIEGLPRLGSTVRLHVRGHPSSPALTLTSPLPATDPTTFTNIGTLFLRRTMLSSVPMPPLDQNGESHLDVYLDPAVYSLGQTFFVQGFGSSPRRLTQAWMQITVLP